MAEAEYNLGVLCASGQGVLKDDKQAARWYRLAAEQCHPDAAFNLAGLYANGVGVSRDLVEAQRWITIAANEGVEDSIRAKERLAARMSEQELERARTLAAAWTPCKDKAACDARAGQ